MDIDLLKEKFQYIFEHQLLEEMALTGRLVRFEADKLVMDIDQPISHIPLLISGSLRVMREDEMQGELLLYYLEVGDTCTVTLNCCTGKSRSQIKAISESEAEILFIPAHKMDEWMTHYASWRAFILDSYKIRIEELLTAIDQLAFRDMKARLKQFLRDKALVNGTEQLRITHLQIANDLNSSRVVISRLMKQLESEGTLTQGRNEVLLHHLFTRKA